MLIVLEYSACWVLNYIKVKSRCKIDFLDNINIHSVITLIWSFSKCILSIIYRPKCSHHIFFLILFSHTFVWSSLLSTYLASLINLGPVNKSTIRILFTFIFNLWCTLSRHICNLFNTYTSSIFKCQFLTTSDLLLFKNFPLMLKLFWLSPICPSSVLVSFHGWCMVSSLPDSSGTEYLPRKWNIHSWNQKNPKQIMHHDIHKESG